MKKKGKNKYEYLPNLEDISRSKDGITSPLSNFVAIVFQFNCQHRTDLRIQFLSPFNLADLDIDE